MGVALVTKYIVSYSQSNAVFAIQYMVNQLYITNKIEYIVLKVGVPCK